MCALLLPIAHETAGAARIRHSLRPLFSRGRNVQSKTRAKRAARTRNCIRSHCERSEAIHLAAQRKNGLLRRFAPRNDGALIFHSPCYSPFAGHGDGGEGTADNQLNSSTLAAEPPLQHFQPVIAEKHFVVANKSRHAEDAVRESERCCIGQSCPGFRQKCPVNESGISSRANEA